jgi:hypothetical protein
VHVAVRGYTASILRSLGVRDIDHPETSTTLEIVGCTDSSDKGCLFVGNNVVAVTESAEVCCQVAPNAEGRRVLGISVKKLGQVKNLKTVSSRLRANVGVVANDLDVTPRRSDCLCRETTDIGQTTVGVNFNKSRAV